MTLYVIGFVIAFLLVLGSGMPVGFGLGVLALGILTAYTSFDMAIGLGAEKAYGALDSTILVAIPLFILVAQLISESGMGRRLFDAAKTFFGGFHSGIGMATISSSGVFSAMTGSSFVSASTMGYIAIPELRRAGYPDKITAAAITAGGSLGSVIPPSLVMIIYGYLTDESIGALFMAGVIPGILLMVLYSITLAFFINRNFKKHGFPTYVAPPSEATTFADPPGSASIVADPEVTHTNPPPTEASKPLTRTQATKEAFWGLMAPVIILGGIYLGVFTASEAAAIAAIYCMIIGIFVYRTINLRKLVSILLDSVSVSAMVAMIIVGGAMMTHGVVIGRVPQNILMMVIELDLPPWVLLIVINLFLFFLGMFLEVLALMYLTIPLLLPVIIYMEWDNIWFAVMMLINVNLALITPPMGGVLYVVSHIGRIPIGTVIKGAFLPIGVLIFVLILVMLFPGIATWLPSVM